MNWCIDCEPLAISGNHCAVYLHSICRADTPRQGVVFFLLPLQIPSRQVEVACAMGMVESLSVPQARGQKGTWPWLQVLVGPS